MIRYIALALIVFTVPASAQCGSCTDMSWVHSKAFPGYGLPARCSTPPKRYDYPSGAKHVVLNDREFRIACQDFYGRRLECANLNTRVVYVRGDFVKPQNRAFCFRHGDAHINGWTGEHGG